MKTKEVNRLCGNVTRNDPQFAGADPLESRKQYVLDARPEFLLGQIGRLDGSAPNSMYALTWR